VKKHILIAISVVALVFGFLLIAPILPMFNGPLHAPVNQIINNLRQIQGAKQQWAFEKGITNEAASVAEADLSPYLKIAPNGPGITPTLGEQYIINPLNVSPEARLTKKLKSPARGNLPAGTVIRFGQDGSGEIVIPTNQTAR